MFLCRHVVYVMFYDIKRTIINQKQCLLTYFMLKFASLIVIYLLNENV